MTGAGRGAADAMRCRGLAARHQSARRAVAVLARHRSRRKAARRRQQRADVAQARRRWIREQGLLDPAGWFLSMKPASTPTWCGSTATPRAARDWLITCRLATGKPSPSWRRCGTTNGGPMVVDGPMNGELFLAMSNNAGADTRAKRHRRDGSPARHKVAGVAGDCGSRRNAALPAAVFAISTDRDAYSNSRRTCASCRAHRQRRPLRHRSFSS